jgi:hypothetical protein
VNTRLQHACKRVFTELANRLVGISCWYGNMVWLNDVTDNTNVIINRAYRYRVEVLKIKTFKIVLEDGRFRLIKG